MNPFPAKRVTSESGKSEGGEEDSGVGCDERSEVVEDERKRDENENVVERSVAAVLQGRRAKPLQPLARIMRLSSLPIFGATFAFQ